MTNELALEFPAQSRQVAAVRHQVASWLDDAGLDDDSAANLVLAVSEAVSNAVEHAYQGPMTGLVQVRAEVSADGSICIAVTDRGRWRVRPATLSSRGRGLLLMRENVDQVIVDRAPTGTTVTLRLARYPVLVPLQQGPRVPVGHEVLVHEASGRVEVVVRGNVPDHAGPTLRRTLSTLARGGAVPLTVDLAEFVGQTGGLVHALKAVAEAARAAGNRLTVQVPRQAAARAAVARLSALVDLRN